MHGRDSTAVQDVAAAIRKGGGTAVTVSGDVTRFDDIEAMRRRIEETLGPVDVLVASAAGRRAHDRTPIPYAAAKAGNALLTQDVAAQAGPHGVRANCIAPETIRTARNAERIPPDMINSGSVHAAAACHTGCRARVP